MLSKAPVQTLSLIFLQVQERHSTLQYTLRENISFNMRRRYTQRYIECGPSNTPFTSYTNSRAIPTHVHSFHPGERRRSTATRPPSRFSSPPPPPPLASGKRRGSTAAARRGGRPGENRGTRSPRSGPSDSRRPGLSGSGEAEEGEIRRRSNGFNFCC